MDHYLKAIAVVLVAVILILALNRTSNVFAALLSITVCIILAVFAIAYFATQYVSLGSVLGAAALCVSFGVLYYQQPPVMICGIAMGLLAIFMHRGNIVRLIKGQERKTNLFKK